jgi:hypothetical protein
VSCRPAISIGIYGLLPVRIAADRVRELDALVGDPDEVRARQSQNIPLRRYGEPAEFRQDRGWSLGRRLRGPARPR